MFFFFKNIISNEAVAGKDVGVDKHLLHGEPLLLVGGGEVKRQAQVKNWPKQKVTGLTHSPAKDSFSSLELHR